MSGEETECSCCFFHHHVQKWSVSTVWLSVWSKTKTNHISDSHHTDNGDKVRVLTHTTCSFTIAKILVALIWSQWLLNLHRCPWFCWGSAPMCGKLHGLLPVPEWTNTGNRQDPRTTCRARFCVNSTLPIWEAVECEVQVHPPNSITATRCNCWCRQCFSSNITDFLPPSVSKCSQWTLSAYYSEKQGSISNPAQKRQGRNMADECFSTKWTVSVPRMIFAMM